MSDALRRAATDAGLPIAEFVSPTSHHAVVDGHRLHYLDWGKPGRPTAIFLHGSALTAHTWDLVALALRDDLRCIAVDLRGHGDSEWSPGMDYRLSAYVRDIRGLINVIAEPVVLIGMSLGGMVALRCAIEEPDNVKAITIIDIGPESERRFREGFSGQTKGGTANRLASFMSAPSEMASIEDFVQQSLAFNPRRNPDSLRSSLTHNLRQLPNGKWAWKYDRRHYGQPPPDGGSFNPWTDLDAVRCPALVVRGGDSDILSAAGAEELAGLLPKASWQEVAGAGHSVQGDNPAGLIAALKPFLADLGDLS